MGWGEEAERLVIERWTKGGASRDIIREVVKRFRCDDKSARRCVAALDFVRARKSSAAGTELQRLKESVMNYGGSDHYVRELERKLDALLVHQAQPSVTSWPDDSLHQQRHADHVEKVKDCAIALEAQLAVPLPKDAGIWWPASSASARSFVESGHRATATGHLAWEAWTPEKPGSIALAVDGNEYLSCLLAHLPAPDIWDGIQDWKGHVANYVVACQDAFRRLVRAIDQSTALPLLPDGDWPRQGLFWAFAAQVFRHYSVLSISPRGAGLRDRLYGVEGPKTSQVPGQGLVLCLTHGDAGIACHQRREVLEDWIEVHRRFLDDSARRDEVELLVEQRRAWQEEAKPFRTLLHAEIERGMFDAGRCPRCP